MLEELRKLEEEGLITLRPHNGLPLLIANYTPTVQYNRSWNEHPLLKECRGLVVDEGENVVGRCLNKFFNYQEHQEFDSLPDIPNEKFEAWEKLDGSCIILFNYKGKWECATRGSFHSDQADYANEVLLPKYDISKLDKSKTYIFEILLKNNRIVVDYGDREELVLLACIDTETDKETDISEIEWPHKAERYDFDSFDEILSNKEKFDDGNTEGFVVKFESIGRVKIKLDEYVRLHRLLTGLTKRTIWELLKEGDDLDELYKTAPDEIYDWVKETKEEILDEYKKYSLTSKVIFSLIKGRLGLSSDLENESLKRKMFAKLATDKYIKESGITPMLFRLYDERDIDELIWKQIKPDNETINT